MAWDEIIIYFHSELFDSESKLGDAKIFDQNPFENKDV
jgi:hypothetical protein